ncbi:MAG: hypothetical protein WCH34_07435 [Bacteroidota bacterium]
MKNVKNILLFVLVSTLSNLHSQTQFANEQQLNAFLKTTTYVVLEETPFSLFNASIENVMKKHWTITPFKIITADEFTKTNRNPQNSFIYISLAQFSGNNSDNLNTFNILNLILGDKSGNINKMPDIGSVPLSYEEVEDEAYAYKLGGLIMAMQYYVNYKIQHPKESIQDLAKKNVGEIKTKELWLVAKELAPDMNTLDKIKKVYPYKVKLVSEEEIEKAIEEKNTNVVFLHKISPEEAKKNSKAQCWIFIISASDGKPLYFDQHKIDNQHPDGLLSDDFKNFAK